MNRDVSRQRIVERRDPWDIAVIGGGATGVGIAVDAASRGYDVVLLEQSDFGKGTSSRSTKLIHGGVRYLQQGNIALVMEALKERGLLLQNAPHLVHDLQFVVPNYLWWEAPFYGIGLKVYDLLAGKYGFGPSQILSREDVLRRIPNLEREGLRGGVLYHDGQFDDSRLLVSLARTAAGQGACLLNYAPVTGFDKDADGFLRGLSFRDQETGCEQALAARCIINATGPFCDAVRRLDQPQAAPMIAPSQGVHVVLHRDFLAGDTAIMVPHTRDGRIMFAIPWHGHVVLGTTDTPISETRLDPVPFEHELEFVLDTAAQYLTRRPTRDDVLSVFTGIRPLVKSGDASSTSTLSRDHTIDISKSGLLTIAGGKWTTYRRMAEDVLDHAAVLGRLPERPCITRDLHVHGFQKPLGASGRFSVYGSDQVELEALVSQRPSLAMPLHEDLPVCGAEVVWAARQEMARTLDDVLARRTRALFLNVRAARAAARETARILAAELGRDESWQRQQLEDFAAIASTFVFNPTISSL